MEANFPHIRSDDESARKLIENTNPDLADILKEILNRTNPPVFPISQSELDVAKRWNLSSLPSLWERLRDELVELGKDSSESEEYRQTLSIITGEVWAPLYKDINIQRVKEFIPKYPVIIWMLYHSKLLFNRIENFLVSTDMMNERIVGSIPKRITLSMIKNIRSLSMAKYLKELIDEGRLKSPKNILIGVVGPKIVSENVGLVWWWLANNLLSRDNYEIIIPSIVYLYDEHMAKAKIELLLDLINHNIIKVDDTANNTTINNVILSAAIYQPKIMRVLLADKRFNPLEAMFLDVWDNIWRWNSNLVASLSLLLEDGRINKKLATDKKFSFYLHSLGTSDLLDLLLSYDEFKPIPDVFTKFVHYNTIPSSLNRILDEPGYSLSQLAIDNIFIHSRNKGLYEVLYSHNYRPSFNVIVNSFTDKPINIKKVKYIIEHGFNGVVDNRAILLLENNNNNSILQLLLNNNVFDYSPRGQQELYNKLTAEIFQKVINNKQFQKTIGLDAVKKWKQMLKK